MKWRRLSTLMRREILATFRDPFTVGIMIAVPLLALMLFGQVLSTEVSGLSLGVHDASRTSASRRLVAELAAAGTFKPLPYATRDALEHALVSGAVGAAIIIPPDFDRNLDVSNADVDRAEVQVIYDGGEAVLAGNAEGFLKSLIAASGANLVIQAPPAAAMQPPNPRESASIRRGGIEMVVSSVFNPRLDGRPFMVAGTFGFVLSFLTVLITAVSIVSEKLAGTFEQLQVTPATSVEILLAKILPLGAVFALDVLLMVLVAGFVMHVWAEGSTLFFLLVSSFYILIALALGLIISATSQTAAEAVQKSVLFSVPLVQLSGFAFPIRSMPWLVRWLAEFFPATHYIRVCRAIYLRGEGPIALLPELILLAIFGVILMTWALRTIEARQ